MKKILGLICVLSVLTIAAANCAEEKTYTEKFIQKHTQKLVDKEKSLTAKQKAEKAKYEAKKQEIKDKQKADKAKLDAKKQEIKDKQKAEKAKLDAKKAEQAKKEAEAKKKIENKKKAWKELTTF
ncbi:hypothetical protein IKA92_06950 [bacterium]|nr:hypothetical protein [bacterium]